MIVAVFVVISHIKLMLLFGAVDCGPSLFLYSNVSLFWVAGVDVVTLSTLAAVLSRLGVLRVVLGGAAVGTLGVVGYDGSGAITELAFGLIEDSLTVSGGWAVDGAELAVVDAILDVDMLVDVPGVRFTITLLFSGDLYALVGVAAVLSLVDAEVFALLFLPGDVNALAGLRVAAVVSLLLLLLLDLYAFVGVAAVVSLVHSGVFALLLSAAGTGSLLNLYVDAGFLALATWAGGGASFSFDFSLFPSDARRPFG
jgi:uncharacterized membrane protein YuzA (DUF378 family)